MAKKFLKEGGTSKNCTGLWYSETTKPEKLFNETKTIEKSKIIKQSHAYKGYMRVFLMLNFVFLESWTPA